MKIAVGVLLATVVVAIAAESADPVTPAKVTDSATDSTADSGSRQGRLLLLLKKKALIAGAPLVIAKGVGAKAGFAKAAIVKKGAVVGLGGLAGAAGLKGLGGLAGTAGLKGLGGLAGLGGVAGVAGVSGVSGLGGVYGGRLVSTVGGAGRVVYVNQAQPQVYYGGASRVHVAKPVVVEVPSVPQHVHYGSSYGYGQKHVY